MSRTDPGPLAVRLADLIRQNGPIKVARYMEEALGHPEYGYYVQKDPFGRRGDFTTAPEISQAFGELIGAWCAVVWRSMGAPAAFSLVELGPGRGTLMVDALRAVKGIDGFLEAAHVHLVESSPALRRRQQAVLSGCGLGREPAWHRDVSQVPGGPMIVVANEFFDALPIRQFRRTAAGGWRERLVGIDPGRPAAGGGPSFAFVLSPVLETVPVIPPQLRHVPPGSIVEVSPVRLRVMYTIARRLVEAGAAALIIDYGHGQSAPGDTLQAVKDHAFHPVLVDPGVADLTAHVDFESLAAVAADAGAAVHGPVTQGAFLERLGLSLRTRALVANATPKQGLDLIQASRRLSDSRQMGTLFKVLGVTQPCLQAPVGFV